MRYTDNQLPLVRKTGNNKLCLVEILFLRNSHIDIECFEITPRVIRWSEDQDTMTTGGDP